MYVVHVQSNHSYRSSFWNCHTSKLINVYKHPINKNKIEIQKSQHANFPQVWGGSWTMSPPFNYPWLKKSVNSKLERLLLIEIESQAENFDLDPGPPIESTKHLNTYIFIIWILFIQFNHANRSCLKTKLHVS